MKIEDLILKFQFEFNRQLQSCPDPHLIVEMQWFEEFKLHID